jgi:N-methylhydantoinase B/oxoprolinase/acetone carboxylase alpha subunit
MTCDGEGELLGKMGSLTFECSLTVDDAGVHVDYTGTCPTSAKAINVPLAYTRAYTCFGLACALANGVPNNAGSLKPFRVDAPEGCILNATYPKAVASRHSVGQLLPDVVFGCLSQIDCLKGKIPAEGASVLWQLNARGLGSDLGADAHTGAAFWSITCARPGVVAPPHPHTAHRAAGLTQGDGRHHERRDRGAAGAGWALGHGLPLRRPRHPARDQ